VRSRSRHRSLRSRARPAIGLLLALAALAGCGADVANSPDSSPGDGFFGAVLDDRYQAPDITLTATTEPAFNFRSSTTKPLTLFFFGYTKCPDVCSAVMASVTSALTRLDDAQRDQVQVVFVTTDPQRDSTSVLSEWLGAFDPSFIGLTGPLPQIVKAGKALHVYVSNGTPLPSGGYDVSHGSEVIAIDARDQSPIVWTEGTSSAQFASDIVRLLDHPL